MDIFDALSLIGGLCLFLFGMNIMGDALERRAGSALRTLLSRLTTNKMTGFLTGLGVTSVIQSSSATTVMVVGFVNSGLMDLKQAIKADRDIKIIDSPEFSEICDDEHLPIIARNALENGISKNLWYEQVLPAKTILYTITVDPDGSLADAIDGKIIQIGADATIGYGYCRFTRLNK